MLDLTLKNGYTTDRCLRLVVWFPLLFNLYFNLRRFHIFDFETRPVWNLFSHVPQFFVAFISIKCLVIVSHCKLSDKVIPIKVFLLSWVAIRVHIALIISFFRSKLGSSRWIWECSSFSLRAGTRFISMRYYGNVSLQLFENSLIRLLRPNIST